jgi:hypothetical protein
LKLKKCSPIVHKPLLQVPLPLKAVESSSVNDVSSVNEPQNHPSSVHTHIGLREINGRRTSLKATVASNLSIHPLPTETLHPHPTPTTHPHIPYPISHIPYPISHIPYPISHIPYPIPSHPIPCQPTNTTSGHSLFSLYSGHNHVTYSMHFNQNADVLSVGSDKLKIWKDRREKA